MTEPKILLMPDVVRMTRLSRRTIDKLITEKKFPEPFKLTNKLAWFENAIVSWIFEQSEGGANGS